MSAHFTALVLGTFVSEDVTTIAAGVLVSQGQLSAASAILACALGIYVGDLGLWLIGRLAGQRVLSWRRVRQVLAPADVQRFAGWFDRHACEAILGSRFAPGTRLPLYLAAGACHTSFLRFAGWSWVAVALWTPLLVGIGATFGDRVGRWLAAGRIVTLATALCVLAGWRLALRLSSVRGRQQLVASLSRVWRWEFWPMWLFYAPVGLWVAWLALRHGGWRTLMAANPGIQHGGVVGESKFDILSRLPAEWAIPSALLESGGIDDRMTALGATLRERAWNFPLILKPDVGQRGTGVRLARNVDDAAEYLRGMSGRVLVQPYHPGPFEAGVFYYRMPGWARGRILCITDKHFPAVVGDGTSSIEDLVWAHRRYRMQARTFFVRLGARRHEVPPAGRRVPLGIAGNHAQGAMFKDGRALITPALEARIDAIARSYKGFFIGRFDLRYGNRDAFVAGCDLAIVELNGATAECTNIYDPDGSLLSAYRQLFRQWQLVFEIGAANRRQYRPARPSAGLLSLLRAHLTSSTPFPVSD